ncbi:uncharacterized protein PHACADRAFT_258345 [Phanerochaete carnosa HHB-10118-sp]|uniref:Homeobox domain-containing protein n=1 Tax=Phanerochaete carnosa (strain HHB-10118-sp) TaxID=650164 RepID=K5WVK0_PHACS|nr:uncharacterized protein PHACADRAFT_258345 [Phanerochaete carnosa HHB-10118-sp]EKM54477.1 hypothetical protein PHACADRAFT_258345 [Phanerochaete carnosa HHB-10118-sp]
MSHPDDHFHIGCFGRPSRRSPNVAGNNTPNPHNSNSAPRRGGFFNMGQGGRTILPPLHLPFRTSHSPAPDSFPTNQFAQDPTQSRGDYGLGQYGQQGWQSNPTATQHAQANQFASDARYQGQTPGYQTYQSRTPSAFPQNPQESRTLPPLSAQHGQLYSQPAIPSQTMGQAPHIRSTSAAGYPVQYGSYPSGQIPQQQPFYASSDPRMASSPVSTAPYDPSGGAALPRRSSMSVDRTVPSRMSSTHGMAPYARAPPSLSSEYDRESVNMAEPTIKKKRKRADAEQLKVLNETYNRTAFPSTEERIELAKKLGMSARSVQIWFQNKRQAMRQSSRQAASAVPPPATEPFTAGPAPGAGSSVAAPTPQALSGGGGAYGGVGSMNSMGMGGPGYTTGQRDQYGRPIPSPPSSSQYRGRSYDEHERRPASRSR